MPQHSPPLRRKGPTPPGVKLINPAADSCHTSKSNPKEAKGSDVGLFTAASYGTGARGMRS